MNRRQLECLDAVDREGNCLQAAKKLHKNSSTIGRTVKAAEEELHVEIFRRNSGKLVPTLEGKIVLEYGRKILNSLEQTESTQNWSEDEIRYLMTLRRFKNMSRTAEELYITQPALSLFLKDINQSFGFPVFYRTKKGMEETAEGKKLLDLLEQVKEEFDQLHLALEDIANLMYGEITLGIPLNLGTYLLPMIIPAFLEKFPGIRFRVREENSQNLERMLLEQKVDVCIMHHHGEDERIHYEDFMQDPFELVMPQKMAMDFCTLVSAAELKKTESLPYIMVAEGQKLRHVVDTVLENANLIPDIYCTTKSMETVKRLVAAGVGISILPESYMTLFSDTKGLCIYPLDPQLEGSWNLTVAVPADRSVSRSTREFVRILSEVL